MKMQEFIEGCKSCDPRADPDGAAELLRHAVLLGEAILQKREKGSCKEDKTDQYLERSERILDMLIKLAENEIKPPKKNAKKQNSAKAFTPPTVEEVSEYCKERKNSVDPQLWIDFYTARGWILNNGKTMKDWKATVRTWEKRNFNKPPNERQEDGEHSYNLDLIIEQARNNPPKMRKEG